MSDKILLALQYYHGDADMAGKVARLIADLEPRRCERADILLVSRFDTVHDQSVVEYVSSKFNVWTHISRSRAEMWPHGCNALWFSTMDYVYTYGIADRIPPYKAILTFEADAVPLIPGWIQALSDGWDAAQASVYGSFQPAPGPHINGNAMFSGDKDFLKWIARDVGGCTPMGGWDYVLYPKFKKWGCANAPSMRSWWGTKTLPKEQYDDLVSQQVVFLHGVKDDSVIQHVRKRFIR